MTNRYLIHTLLLFQLLADCVLTFNDDTKHYARLDRPVVERLQAKGNQIKFDSFQQHTPGTYSISTSYIHPLSQLWVDF